MARTRAGRFVVGFVALTGVTSVMAPHAMADEVVAAKPAVSNTAAGAEQPSVDKDKAADGKAVTLQALKVTAQTTPAEMARAIQQGAPNIINVLPATEIQKLPDVNAAEAVRRVPGISLESDTGEGRFVNIRGLDADLNGTTFGGVRLPPTNLASPMGGGRAVAFDSIPTGLIGAITVTKTNTPDQDAEALGGTIEITPKQVPPGKDRFFEAEVGTGIETLRNTPIKDYSLSGGGRFGADNAFSFIGTIAYYEDKRGVDDIEGSYADDQSNGTPDKVMNDFEQRYYRYHRRRLGYGGEFNYQPDADNRWYVRYFDAGYTESVSRQRLTYNMFQGGTGSVMVDPSNPKGFIDPNVTYDKSLRDEKETIDTRVLTLGGENHFQSFKIDYLAAATYGSYNKPFDYNSDFASPGAVNVAYDNISDPRFPRFRNLNGPNPLDPANYALSSLQNSTEHDHNQEYTGAFNVTIPTSFFQGGDDHGADENIKFGASARKRDRHGSIERFTYGVPALPLTQFATNNAVTFYDNHYQNGNNINGTALRNFLSSNPGLFPLANPQGDQQSDAQGTSSAKEDVYALYGQYQFAPTEKLSVLTGVRWERTLATYVGNQILRDTNGNFVGAIPNSRSHSYGNFFPTVQLRYELAEDLVARANYSKTIARPGFNQVTAAILIDPAADNVTQGNPNLKPTTSDNFDLSLEYYLNDGGVASVGVFDKELSNYIVNKEEVGVIFPNNGLFAGFTGAAKVFTFDNLSSAHARGIELNYQQKFTRLPGWLGGFGVGANYTYVNSSGEIRPGEHLQLPSTSRNTGNLMLFYDKGGLNVNLGAYYVSKNIFGVGGSAATDIWSQARFSLDLGASYAIDQQWSLFLNAKNLTNTRLKFTEGPSNSRPIQREFYEQTITVGARFKL
ncbi:TonB-dependent receptor [Dyella tabacisoli]|uniref:TonB-dependent receptor n=1 Tax=Dyella tabacisoli TaxID=2282381 RepID=A0A369URA4_9GAMM|nr:TonB-dependent receptor [Dyella tabacisoli]RDD82585.1 TonB-dependent receptor [Dyella tabacisoli]